MNTERMIALPSGRVTLSDRRTQSSWTVELEPFRLAGTPVTQRQYAMVTGEHPGPTSGDGLPVVNVSWWDAVRYCNALSRREGLRPAYRFPDGGGKPEPDPSHGGREHDLSPNDIEWDRSADGYRLPTEAEWEFACRAGTTGPRYGPLDEIAWYRENSHDRIHDVGGRTPNPWGLYDMLGNAWEWCWDIYDAEVYGDYRVIRGGGWCDEHWSCRASVRRRTMPTLQIDDLGFRPARSRSY